MDQIDQLLTLYDRRDISRRDLLSAFALIGTGGAMGLRQQPAARGRTLNHVSIEVSDLRRSTEFYDALLQLPVRDRGSDYCEYRLANGFLGLYREAGMTRGLDHVAIGVERYDARATLQAVRQALPNAPAKLAFEDQVYVTDPDGARIQLCDVDYKR